MVEAVNRKSKIVNLSGFLLLSTLLLSIYTLTNSGKFHIVDEVSLFAVTESIALRGEVDTNAIAWTQWVNSPGEVLGAFGEDGQVYSKKGPAPAFVAVPWYWLIRLLSWLGLPAAFVQSTLLWNGIITTATALLLWLTALRLGYDDKTGALLGLLFGLCTIAWPYANHFFGEPLSAWSLLLCFYGLLSFRQTQQRSWLWLAGIGGGLAFATVTAHAILLAILGLYWLTIIIQQYRSPIPNPQSPIPNPQSPIPNPQSPIPNPQSPIPNPLIPSLLPLALPILLAVLSLLWYNHLRFGNPFDTGYHFDTGEGFTTPILDGLWGLLVSPYRGVFWHTPLFLVSVGAFVPFWKRHRMEATVIGLLSLALIVLYSTWWMWWGGFAWGPRFLIPLTPFWVLPLVPLLGTEGTESAQSVQRIQEKSAKNPSVKLRDFSVNSVSKWMLIGISTLSFLVQLSAVLVNYVNYEIRLREIFPTNWADPLEFGPPAQSLDDWIYSPVIGQWILIKENLVGNTDLVWLWADGNIQWSLLTVGLITIILSVVVYLRWLYAGQERSTIHGAFLAFGLTLLLVGIWLPAAARNPHYGTPEHGYRQVLRTICELADPNDAIVTVAPPAYSIAMTWQPSLCRQQRPIYGYAENSAEHPEAISVLNRLLEQHRQIWFVTAGLPPNAPSNSVERWFAHHAYKASDQWYQDYRLVAYTTPAALANTPNQQMDIALYQSEQPVMTLLTARVPTVVDSGQILPIELTYQLHQTPAHQLRWFVQLLDSNGVLAALLDSPPMHGYRMFPELASGGPLAEHVGLLLPKNLDPGEYRLIAGLYDPEIEGSPRLTTQNGADYLHITDIKIRVPQK